MKHDAAGAPVEYIDYLDDLFFVFDETGGLLEYNRATTEVTGYDDEALSAMTPADFFEGEDADRIAGKVAEVLDTGTASVEAELVTADGERIPYEFRARRLPENSGGGATFVGVGRDVSERRAAERERRAILDRMTDGFFALDTDWRVTYANDEGARILAEAMGEDPAEADVEGRDVAADVPGFTDTRFYEQYSEALRSQEPVAFEAYYEPMASWFDVRAYPSPSGLSVYFRDVTERRRRREAMESREAVLRRMHEVIADRERPFEAQVEALLALGRAELDTDYGTLSAIEDDQYVFEVVDAADDAVQAGDPVPLSATNCERIASTERTLVLDDIAADAPDLAARSGNVDLGIACYIGAPLFVEDEVYGTFCFYDTEPREEGFSDWEVTLVDLMSRWVSYELERRETAERLRRQNRRLDRFASLVSHDLRNPLSTLEGAIVLTEEHGDLDRLADAHDAIDRMNELVDDLLTLATAGEVVDGIEPVDLATTVEECWGTVPSAGATLRVETTATVPADPARLRQLLENLLANAVEHGGEGVTITVGDLPDGFYVEDDGPGIPEAERDRVFDSDYTTGGAEGTGLGLAIVREVADGHGWTVAVEEGTDGGARFAVTGVGRE